MQCFSYTSRPGVGGSVVSSTRRPLVRVHRRDRPRDLVGADVKQAGARGRSTRPSTPRRRGRRTARAAGPHRTGGTSRRWRRSAGASSSTDARAAGEMFVTSSSENALRGERLGQLDVRLIRGRALAGQFRRRRAACGGTGNSGLPVTRSSSSVLPIFVTAATASTRIVFPSRVASRSRAPAARGCRGPRCRGGFPGSARRACRSSRRSRARSWRRGCRRDGRRR